MFRILKRNDPLLQQFEIIEKENAEPRFENNRINLIKELHENKTVPSERDVLEQAFDSMMVAKSHSFCTSALLSLRKDDMQIPPNLRPKLKGMDPVVKSSMLRSARQVDPSGPQNSRTLRRTKSSEGLESPRSAKNFNTTRKANSPVSKPSTSLFTSALLDSSVNIPDLAPVHLRGVSLDISATKSTIADSKSRGLKDLSVEKINRHLSQTSSTKLDLELLKKLRLLLRNETTGYASMNCCKMT